MEMRHRHATVGQLRAALAEFKESDIVCTLLPPTGNLPVCNADEDQLGWIEMTPMDLPGSNRLPLFAEAHRFSFVPQKDR